MRGREVRELLYKKTMETTISLGIVLFFIVTVQERSFFLFVVEKENE